MLNSSWNLSESVSHIMCAYSKHLLYINLNITEATSYQIVCLFVWEDSFKCSVLNPHEHNFIPLARLMILSTISIFSFRNVSHVFLNAGTGTSLQRISMCVEISLMKAELNHHLCSVKKTDHPEVFSVFPQTGSVWTLRPTQVPQDAVNDTKPSNMGGW